MSGDNEEDAPGIKPSGSVPQVMVLDFLWRGELRVSLGGWGRRQDCMVRDGLYIYLPLLYVARRFPCRL